MAWNKDDYPYTWKDLEGKIASAVFCAPRTGGDPASEWPEVHTRVIGYIVRHVVGKPWADHLALMAMVFTAQRRDVSTVEELVRRLNKRFSSLFSLFNLDCASQWNVDQHVVPYLRGEVLSEDPLATRVHFFKRYMSATNIVTSWLDFLPAGQQEMYRPFLLPTINPFLAKEFSKVEQEWERQQKAHRKGETEAVVPQFTALRAEAHFRYNRIHRLWLTYQQARGQVLPDHSNLPLDFSYEEGDPPIERIVCRLWDRRSFVLYPKHPHPYSQYTIDIARRKQRSFTDERNELFLEIMKVEQQEGGVTPEGFWFTDILRHGVFGSRARFGTQREREEKQVWLRQWGYGEAHGIHNEKANKRTEK